MSQRALTLAVRDILQAKFNWSPEECDITPPEGRPPALAGEFFAAVWEGGFTGGTTESRYDVHKVNVTLTRRAPVAPYDREAAELIHEIDLGLEVVADRVAATVDQNYDVMNQANQYILAASGNASVYGFCEPLRLLNLSRTQPRSEDWLHGEREPGRPEAARTVTINFGMALRLQSKALQA